ncbi:MAG: hypothetical protein NWF09_08370 [Candidatus Bathyarchaeota archaeon]|nr:hypothetical protein [Candidatus Bathyarchaeota archaeon]
MDKQIEFLIKLRDAGQMIADAANEYLDAFAPPEAKDAKQSVAVQEATFSILRFEPQQGAKLGEYEIAYRAGNLEDKWRSAYNILCNSNATMQNRYHGEGYQYSYWLYGEDRIYRQKLKPKPSS